MGGVGRSLRPSKKASNPGPPPEGWGGGLIFEARRPERPRVNLSAVTQGTALFIDPAGWQGSQRPAYRFYPTTCPPHTKAFG